MAREVDIWWESKEKLKASMRWTNKRGRISFFLIPSSYANCPKCPFMCNPICNKWRKNKRPEEGSLCSMLWNMEGNNNFVGREEIYGWQPLGPLRRGNKKNRKHLTLV